MKTILSTTYPHKNTYNNTNNSNTVYIHIYTQALFEAILGGTISADTGTMRPHEQERKNEREKETAKPQD